MSAVENEKAEWVLVGDPLDKKGNPHFCGCLIRLLGRKTKAEAEECLKRFMSSPKADDVSDKEKFENIRVKRVEDRDCWWNDSFMMSD